MAKLNDKGMKNSTCIAGLLFVVFLVKGSIIKAQPSLWFGTVKTGDSIAQGRFEITGDSIIKSVVYAPYGISATAFKKVKHQDKKLSFEWQINELIYQCLLNSQDATSYTGVCTCEKAQPIELIIRKFSQEDAYLQGDTLHAGTKDIQILDRALSLLNNGVNWNRFDKRVCNIDSYPYKWSLFCALHQASIDVDSEYRHLRPAVQATRQAIEEITEGKKYAHLLQDYNNEAKDFEAIAKALNGAKKIIAEKIKRHQ